MMDFEFFIARRYLFSKRKVKFVSVINFVSILGITVGAAALLVIMSVFNGFTGVVSNVLVSFDPHLRIEKKGGLSLVEMQRIEGQLRANKNVRAFSPFVSGKALIFSKSFDRAIALRGVDENTIGRASGITDKIVLGSFDFRDSVEVGSIVLGLTLADRLGVVVGSEVGIATPTMMASALTPFGSVPVTKFRVSGIYESNNKDYDANYAYVSLQTAQRLFRMENVVSGIDVRLRNIKESEDTKEDIDALISSNYQISTWYDLHKDLYSVMKIERWVAFILLCLIVIVASFNLLGSMTMSVIEKRRDLGVLRSMGATRQAITRIFIWEGITVGILGAVFGVALSLILLFLQIRFQLFPLDQTVYIIPAIPVEIQIADFLVVVVAVLLFSIAAAYYPARRAARVDPLKSIRWE